MARPPLPCKGGECPISPIRRRNSKRSTYWPAWLSCGIYPWYISVQDWSATMSKTKTAKLFLNGRSQAVRVPREFRFEGDEVRIRQVGRAVLLLPPISYT